MSFALISQVVLCTQTVTAQNSFEQWAPKITEKATIWADKVTKTLSPELQLTYLNLFALSEDESIEAFIKCAEFIESQEDMLVLHEELGTNIMDVIKKYAEQVQERIARKKNISDKEKESLWQKLESKIQELVVFINAIYYQALHNAMTKSNVSLKYMFDKNGLIAQEKRTRSLPQTL